MIVVDTSVALKWIFSDEVYVAESDALLVHQVAIDEAVLAPPLIYSEVANAIRQRVRRKQAPPEQALALFDEFFAMPITVSAPTDLYHQALHLANHYSLPADYDAHFVALAQLNECDLWTADRSLVRQIHDASFVRWIGDYAE